MSQLASLERLHDSRLAGAELANILNEAALEAVRRGGSIITTEDVYNGMDRILQVPSHPVLALESLCESYKGLASHARMSTDSVSAWRAADSVPTARYSRPVVQALYKKKHAQRRNVIISVKLAAGLLAQLASSSIFECC